MHMLETRFGNSGRHFASVKKVDENLVDKTGFVQWITRHWSSKLEPEFCELSCNDAFDRVRRGKCARLPLSYAQLGDIYLNMDAIRAGLAYVDSDKEVEEFRAKKEQKDAARINQTGDLTFKTISHELQITGTAVKNLGDSAQDKIKGFAVRRKDGKGGNYTAGFDVDEEDFEERAMQAIAQFVRVLKVEVEEAAKDTENGGDFSIDNLLESMLTMESGGGFMTRKEIPLITDEERVALYLLLEMIRDGQEEEVIRLCYNDLTESDNILKTLQNANARVWFPPLKRGRKKAGTAVELEDEV